MCCFPGFGYLPLGSLEFPISPLAHAVRACRAALALLGSAVCCCLGLSCSFPSVSLLKGKQTSNPVSESAFWSLHPFGGKNPLSIAAGAISSPQAWQRAVSAELEALEITGFAGLCRHTACQFGPTECDSFPQERIKVPTQA